MAGAGEIRRPPSEASVAREPHEEEGASVSDAPSSLSAELIVSSRRRCGLHDEAAWKERGLVNDVRRTSVTGKGAAGLTEWALEASVKAVVITRTVMKAGITDAAWGHRAQCPWDRRR